MLPGLHLKPHILPKFTKEANLIGYTSQSSLYIMYTFMEEGITSIIIIVFAFYLLFTFYFGICLSCFLKSNKPKVISYFCVITYVWEKVFNTTRLCLTYPQGHNTIVLIHSNTIFETKVKISQDDKISYDWSTQQK